MRNSLFNLNTRTVVTISIGAALYGIVGLFSIPIGPNTQLKPAIIILSVFAVFFGPFVGFFAGFIGHILTDMLAGWGLWWNWELSSGFFGFFAGLVYLFRGFDIKYGLFKKWHIVFLLVSGLVGFLVGYLFSGTTDIILMGEAPRKIYLQVILIALSNSLVFIFFAIPLIIGYLRTHKKTPTL